MSGRYTRKDAERAFDVGGWMLDYNGVYGGFQVQEPVNVNGGITLPLGDMRRNAREFCEAVHFVARALEAKEHAHTP